VTTNKWLTTAVSVVCNITEHKYNKSFSLIYNSIDPQFEPKDSSGNLWKVYNKYFPSLNINLTLAQGNAQVCTLAHPTPPPKNMTGGRIFPKKLKKRSEKKAKNYKNIKFLTKI